MTKVGSFPWLNVRSLEDISKLEDCVEHSATLLLFLSRNYASSMNCRRELLKAHDLSRPIIVVHESDEMKGGALLSVLEIDFMRACELPNHPLSEEVVVNVFQCAPCVPWQRSLRFQQVSLKAIATHLLHALASSCADATVFNDELYFSREELLSELTFRKAVVLYTSDANKGAAAIANQLLERLPSGSGLKLTSPGAFAASTVGIHEQSTHWLVLLSSSTFKDNELLIDELHSALQSHIQLVLVHQTDPSVGGCPFQDLIDTAPQKLKDLKLFNACATPWCSGLHRDASLHNLAAHLGAKRINRTRGIGGLCGRSIFLKWQISRKFPFPLKRKLDDDALLQSRAIEMTKHEAASNIEGQLGVQSCVHI